MMFCVFAVVDVTVPPTNVGAQEGGNITLSCEVSSDTNVTVTWWHGDREVSEKDVRVSIRRNGSMSILTITNAESGDAGEYRCNATSPATGLCEVSSAGKVRVYCK